MAIRFGSRTQAESSEAGMATIVVVDQVGQQRVHHRGAEDLHEGHHVVADGRVALLAVVGSYCGVLDDQLDLVRPATPPSSSLT
jgi:hypothetical protein